MRIAAFLLAFLAATSVLAADLPISVWYGGGKVRAPMLEPDPVAQKDVWRKDLLSIKATGFDTIRCWIDWASAEPKEGQYDFRTLEVLTDLAAELGMRVIVQVYVDSAPDWVGRKYPDSHFVNISGDVMPSHAAPGYCFDHPAVRKAVLGFFTALAERMKGRRSFLGWDLWSEPHVINWAQATYLPSAEFCFCPYSVARFRGWLQAKYPNLDALNRSWYRRFESWDEVEPNRLSTILSYTDYIDWRSFIVDKLAEDLRMRRDAVKRVLPDRVATSHAAAPSLFTSPLGGDGTPDDWKMTPVVDYWGTSLYPKHAYPVGRDAAWRGALLDFTRSSTNGAFWVGELQGGFGTIALRISSTVTPTDVRNWMWSALARGAKGVHVYAWYPMSSGYESGGFGLINLDGTVTERAKRAGAVARTVAANRELLAGARPVPAEVAIVYNPLAYMVGGRRPQYATAGQGEVVNIERNSMLGVYRSLFGTNVPVDFIHVDEIAAGKAERYKLVYLPYPLMLSASTARGLVQFVKNGGALVSEARAAWNDEHGKAREIIPGHGLHEVCGCREEAIQTTPTGKTELELVVPFGGLEAGTKLQGLLFAESLKPSATARMVAKFADGTAAVVEHAYGKGRMLTVGTFLGSAFEADRRAELSRFLIGLLDWANVSRLIDAPGLEVRRLQNGESTLFAVFNHGEPARGAKIGIRLPAGRYQVRDVESGERAEHTTSGGPLVLARSLESGEVWIFELRSRE
ncbi:MAG: beta-galactosidase [Thermoanaerobaculia bacterium]